MSTKTVYFIQICGDGTGNLYGLDANGTVYKYNMTQWEPITNVAAEAGEGQG